MAHLLKEQEKKGLVSEKEIDQHLMKVLSGRFELGEMDDDALVPWANIPTTIINNKEHQQLALDMARETMTLLQNKNNLLPLNKKLKKIALIGPNAANEPMLWGNYNGTPVRTFSILKGLGSKLPSNSIVYDKACDLVENKVTQSYFEYTSANGLKGFTARYWNNRERTGESIASTQITNTLKITTAGDHEFAPGVKLEGFSASYTTEFTAPATEEIVFKTGPVS